MEAPLLTAGSCCAAPVRDVDATPPSSDMRPDMSIAAMLLNITGSIGVSLNVPTAGVLEIALGTCTRS